MYRWQIEEVVDIKKILSVPKNNQFDWQQRQDPKHQIYKFQSLPIAYKT